VVERSLDLVASGEPAADIDEAALSAALPGGGWRLWRSALLRGAGFPAQDILRLSSPAFAEAAGRLLDIEDRVAALRAQALREVNDLLDRLRQEGRWEDKAQRRPLLKAVQSLTAGKLPAEAPHPATAGSLAALRDGEARLLEHRRDLEAVVDREHSRFSREVAAVAGTPAFREAVIWQNPHAATTGLDSLRRGSPDRRDSQQRQHEQLVVSYLQRYCVKNDTIGFFGPVAHAWLSDEGPAATLEPGAGLLQRREVYFENWAVDALAKSLAAAPNMRPWLAPRLKSSFHLAGDTLHRAFGPPARLTAFQARLLAACDGTRTARDIAAGLAAEAGPDAVYGQLAEWAGKHILAWTLEVPLELYPLRTLERLLRRVEDPVLREPAMAALDRLDGARRRVAAAAGDPDGLHKAMIELEGTFSALTGAVPNRAHGATYAARGVVYEDCRRDVRLQLGPGFLERLGAPLSFVLDSAHWLTGELTARVYERMLALHEQMSRSSVSGTVDSLPFFSHVFGTLMRPSQKDPCFAQVTTEFRSRWARLLGEPASRQPDGHLRFTSAGLRGPFDELFGNPRPGWSLSRYLSPDVMVCAPDIEAFQRGDFTPVLGEIHSGNTLLSSCFVSQHPDLEQLRQSTGLPRNGESILFPQALKYKTTQRMNVGLVPLRSYYYLFGDDAAPMEGVRMLPASAVVIERAGDRLLARSRDGRLEFDAIDLLGLHLTEECNDVLGALLPRVPHQPRILIDDLVVSRERWVLDPATVTSAQERQPIDRLTGLRRWARGLGLPRFCFYKISAERKPCYLDLDSPVLLEMFAKMLRAALEQGEAGVTLTVTEMLPRLDQLWLVDRAGNRYTSELRFAAFRP
jgi:hypothetical protein